MLILTEDSDNLSLWACQPDLKLSLLLRDNENQKLDQSSFFNFVEVASELLDEECEEASQELALVCSTGDTKKSFSLYQMPEFKKETEEGVMSDDEQLLQEKTTEITGFQEKMNFYKAKILALFSVQDEQSKTNNIVLIANG